MKRCPVLSRLGLIPVLAVLIAFVALGLGMATENVHAQKDSTSTLDDLTSVEDLMARFNADAGSPRLLLLLSPT